jgi:sugar phosphate isomerase/epimerase
MKQHLSRLCLTACAILLSWHPLHTEAKDKQDVKISVQLYSVRGDMKKDFEGTLKKIAAMGFDGVEFAGYFDYADKPDKLKALLDELGLEAAATHLKAQSFEKDKLDDTIAFHKAIDCKLLIIPVDWRFAKDVASNKQFSDFLNEVNTALTPHGLYTGYHNHAKEFSDTPDQSTWWDVFANNTDQRIILQNDVGWTWKAGKDAAAYISKYPGRATTVHLKPKVYDAEDTSLKPFIGENGKDWKAVIHACLNDGGTQWLSVEQEDYPDGLTPLECVERSYKNLKKILTEMGY